MEKAVARVTDRHVGVCSHNEPCCPHGVSGPIVQGSPNTFTNSLKQARDGDMVTHNCPHCGVGWIVASSETVFVNGKKIARLDDTVIYPGGSGKIVEASPDVFSG
ncbi:PAAR domain-containing protein [Lysinibacillus sp. KU-BSD001]|uniref:PAAR domain-containing protein n=1 Tax=Lysinibacillus sp. KU-BSD001 TaxID=3141328 RepID=UPI0036DFF99E